MASNKQPGAHQAPLTSKMRNSCNACADAKIGCSKGKPTCDRCARRGETCVYVPTRRAGRPALNKQKRQANAESARATTATTPTTAVPAAIVPPTTASSNASTGRWPNEAVVHSAITPTAFDTPMLNDPAVVDTYLPDWITMTSMDESSNSMSPLSQSFGLPSSGSLMSSALDNEDSAFSSNLFIFGDDQMQAVGEAHGYDDMTVHGEKHLPGPGVFTTSRGANQMSSLFDDEFLPSSTPSLVGSTATAKSQSPPSEVNNWFSSSYSSTKSLPSSATSILPSESGSPTMLPGSDLVSACDCMARSLRLLGEVTPSGNPADAHGATSHSPTFESVISRNRSTIASLNKIVRCPCSNDPSLLFILAMVAFKVLGWYAACASTAPPTKDLERDEEIFSFAHLDRSPRLTVQPPTSMTMMDCDFDDDDQDRVVCPLVLSELYGVRRTVHALSERLEACEKWPRRLTTAHGPVGNITQDLLFNGHMFKTAGSDALATGVGEGLRYYLRTLCQAIVNKLSES